jgi:hypothetical protein
MNKGLNNHWKKKKPLIFIFILAGIAVLIWILMLLWNAILPDVIGVNEISYWQAFGIFILSKILFGGFKGGGRKHKEQKYKEKFMNLTDDQKETFKSEWKSRCK